MSTARKITVVLTEPQYEALMSAVVLLSETFAADGPASVGMGPHVPRSLDSAWARVSAAWYAPRNSAARHE